MVRTFSNEVTKDIPIPDDISSMTSPSFDTTPMAANGAIVSRLQIFKSQKLVEMLNKNANIIELYKFMEGLAPKIEESHSILKQMVQK